MPAALTALVLGVPTAASDLGLQNVNLSCNDGTNLALALDATGLTQLSDAVSAMSLYPAGDPALACSLTQSATLTTSSSPTFSSTSAPTAAGGNGGNPQHDYAVGGGQFLTPGCLPSVEEENFGLSAHVDDGAPMTDATGSFTLSRPASICTGQGHLNATVDCLVVSGMRADLTAHVNHANGSLAALDQQEITVDTIDSGTNTGDTIAVFAFTSQCQFLNPNRPVDRGNVRVNDATP